MQWNLCDEEVKTQVRKRIEKSRKTQRVATQELAKHKDRKRKSETLV